MTTQIPTLKVMMYEDDIPSLQNHPPESNNSSVMDWKSLLDEIENEDDWPDDAKCMRVLEKSLRCAICHASMKAPVMLVKCGHSFCSYCIRQALGIEQFCPLCKKTASESDIVRNITVTEIVEVFKEHRKGLVEWSQRVYCSRSSQKRDCPISDASINLEENTTEVMAIKRSQPTRSATKLVILSEEEVSTVSSGSECEQGETNGSGSDSDFVDDPPFHSPTKRGDSNDTQSECPICGDFYSQDLIEQHASTCDGGSHSPTRLTRPFSGFIPEQSTPRSTLPNLCYKLMKTSEIKKLLQRFSITTSGSREQLIERHRQFTLRYNAELDALNPVPVWRIVQMVESNEEKTKAMKGK